MKGLKEGMNTLSSGFSHKLTSISPSAPTISRERGYLIPYIYIYLTHKISIVDVIKTVFLFLIIKKNVKKFKIRVLATYMIAEYLTKKNSLVVIIKNGIYLLTMHNIILKICTT